nr:hypothetical protein [uncultured Cohaesibacter sp.]
MKPSFCKRKYVSMAAIVCAASFIAIAAEAACVRNDTPKSLYVVMKSKASRVERTFVGGETVCLTVGKREKAKVNVLPFSGARFGCRTEIRAGQTVGLDQFGTMNKCHFQTD